MGYKYEVSKWELKMNAGDHNIYRYAQVYAGDSLVMAILAMRKAKKTSGCVKLEWR